MGNSGTITFGSFTLTPGQAHTISGITVSDASTGLVIDGSTVPLSTMYPLLSHQSPTPVHASGVYAVAGGQSFTVAPLGSSIVVNGGGTTFTLADGSATTANGQIFSAASDGGSVFIDGSRYLFSATVPVSATATGAVITATNGRPISVVQDGSSVIVYEDGTSFTLPAGSATTVSGQRFSAVTGGGSIVVDGSTFALTALAPASAITTAAVVFTDTNGQAMSVIQYGNSIVVHENGTTFTLADGAATTVNGETYSVASSGGNIAIDGVTHSLTTPPTTAQKTGASFLDSGGRPASALQEGNSIVIFHSGTSFTLADGSATTIGGEVFSAVVSGGDIVVNDATFTLSTISAKPSLTRTYTLANGDIVTVIEAGNSTIVEHGSLTTQVPAGAILTIDGQTVSALLGSSGSLVDGRSSMQTASAASSSVPSFAGSGSAAVTSSAKSAGVRRGVDECVLLLSCVCVGVLLAVL
ncbi:hypothetical protein LTR28_008725 [Elasticomyces elasticus]|nr:hypothetical protein LTR28_008725 [Elasticomyces elasticus]